MPQGLGTQMADGSAVQGPEEQGHRQRGTGGVLGLPGHLWAWRVSLWVDRVRQQGTRVRVGVAYMPVCSRRGAVDADIDASPGWTGHGWKAACILTHTVPKPQQVPQAPYPEYLKVNEAPAHPERVSAAVMTQLTPSQDFV